MSMSMWFDPSVFSVSRRTLFGISPMVFFILASNSPNFVRFSMTQGIFKLRHHQRLSDVDVVRASCGGPEPYVNERTPIPLVGVHVLITISLLFLRQNLLQLQYLSSRRKWKTRSRDSSSFSWSVISKYLGRAINPHFWNSSKEPWYRGIYMITCWTKVPLNISGFSKHRLFLLLSPSLIFHRMLGSFQAAFFSRQFLERLITWR